MKQTILITGVGRRLGLAMAEHFADQDFHVIGTFRTDRESLENLRSKGVELVQCDLNQHAQVEALCDQVSSNTSSLRCIIHNASDWASEKDMEDLWDGFDTMMAVHAKAPYVINMRLESMLCEGADIIHISDYVAATGSAKHIAYAASKSAIENLTYSFAKRLAPKCKVNAVAPALMLFNAEDSESYKEKALSKSLLGREGGTEEFLDTIKFLMASNFITGRVLPLDGGRHIK